jgi:hypothetical protein
MPSRSPRRSPGAAACDLRLYVDGVDVGPCRVAESYLARLRGLLGHRRVTFALLLRDCRSVHGAGMLTSLDVALLDDDLTVRHLTRLWPFGLVGPRPGVRHVLEAAPGTLAGWGVKVGSVLTVGPAGATD